MAKDVQRVKVIEGHLVSREERGDDPQRRLSYDDYEGARRVPGMTLQTRGNHHPRIPLRGLSLSIEVLLKMTNRMNRKTTTILPRLIIGLTSMNPVKHPTL